ncbi:MAG: hypothetical protein ACJ71T_13905 [Actinomycetales bacterium]
MHRRTAPDQRMLARMRTQETALRTEQARLPPVFDRPTAISAGYTRHQVTQRARSGRWIALRRGVFCLRETYDTASPGRRNELQAAAARLANRALNLVDSHITAASRLALPLPLGEFPRATLTDGCIAHSPRVDRNAVVQVASLWPGDVIDRSEGPLTSAARTAADCLRHYSAEISVPLADAAARSGQTSLSAIAEVLGRQATWPYAARAAAGLPLVDGRRESWLESVSAVRLWGQGVDLAEPQVEVFDELGTFVARVDALWYPGLVVGEADGITKYSLADWAEPANAGAEALRELRMDAVRRVVRREKEREDRLRETGLEVVRWSTAEIMGDPARVARRVQQALARAKPERFRGTLRPTPAR